jgi:hypothetical protein
MENQHYRELNEQEIALINRIKETGKELAELVGALGGPNYDQRWISIGTTHLQQGLMALTRAVAKPEFF